MVIQDEITKLVRKAQDFMGLSHWEITVSFALGEDAFAKCEPEPKYWRADLSFNLDKVKTLHEARQCVIHEMMHCVLSPYTMAAQHFAGPFVAVLDDLEESLVTQVENWPLWDYTDDTDE